MRCLRVLTAALIALPLVALPTDLTARGGRLAPTPAETALKHRGEQIYGDADESGAVSALDASLVLRHAAGIIIIDDPLLVVTDVSGNGHITAYDAALILRFVAGMIDCFPAEPACEM